MNPKVRTVIEFMKANLHRQLTLEEIVERTGLSHSRINDLFKIELGKSPMQYHKSLKLEKARELLANSVMKIKQIRLAVGYQDHAHFFRDFKRHFGLTPSQYRARQATKPMAVTVRTQKTGGSSTKQ
jgi:transcriptional regulator GlxA family with amidase domain